ncbi:MAG: carboxypeptidase regulatory-like domain-containing protein, partial [Verrucomicrobiota bacterium]
NVVLDKVRTGGYTAWFMFGNSISFGGQKMYKFKRKSREEYYTPAYFEIDFDAGSGPKQTYGINVLPGEKGVTWTAGGIRQGEVVLGGKKLRMSVFDGDADGNYADYGSYLQIKIQDPVLKKSWNVSKGYPFKVNEIFYSLRSISSNGVQARISRSVMGTVEGAVTDADTGEPLKGATVYFGRVGLSAETDAEGRYSLELPEGRYDRYRTTLDRYVPDFAYPDDYEVRPSYFYLKANGSVTNNVRLAKGKNPPRGLALLKEGGSWHCLSGETRRRGYGDFDYQVDRGVHYFNQRGSRQRGMKALGQDGRALEQIPLDDLELKKPDVYGRGPEAQVGDVYVCHSRLGEGERMIVFRVKEIVGKDSLRIEYVYR